MQGASEQVIERSCDWRPLAETRRTRIQKAEACDTGAKQDGRAADSSEGDIREDEESDRNARETVNSFRRLTLNEIQAARPLRIKIITVQPGDTVESLSHRMSGVDRAAERFRILNGLEAHAQVKVRDKVKIVVD
jgi:hypothetical protein